MKPPAFDYHAPGDLGEALRILAEVRGKVLAGGQSLIPMLNMRLVAPGHLVDINRLTSLATIDSTGTGVRVGALVRHSAAERSGAHPLLTRALKLVAHPVIRNRGTVVGSLVHADPAAELPAVLAVLGGSVRLARWDGGAETRRDVDAGEFFVGPMESAVQPDELAVSAYFPALGPRTGAAFEEVARRHGDYALAGVCAVVTLDEDGGIATARLACIGVGPTPVVMDVREPAAVREAAVERVRPDGDIHATAAYRRHLVGVLAERALRNAVREAEARGA
ncbi:FAD binding domain-containing protein [Nonomuraea purpurea]|uniref:FAD binding domain-containing protein n=1 Tax=Nonomuraea purpurea TaxID=1849276 RepID=A0ABV8G9J0_9ACTN